MSEVNYGAFKQAKHFREGRIAPKRLIVVHCTAGVESTKGAGAEGVMEMFARGERVASAHTCSDQNSITRSVHDNDTAYAAKNANACGLHHELVGLADQSRAQWLDPISRATIKLGARVCRDWSGLYRIEQRRLTVAEVRRILEDPSKGTMTGFTDHATVDKAMPSSGHWDPGPYFPWDIFMAEVKGGPAPGRTVVRNPHAKPDYVNRPFTKGAKGTQVRWMQWAIHRQESGVFGEFDLQGIVALQRKYRLEPDGIVGERTGNLLRGFTR